MAVHDQWFAEVVANPPLGQIRRRCQTPRHANGEGLRVHLTICRYSRTEVSKPIRGGDLSSADRRYHGGKPLLEVELDPVCTRPEIRK